MGKYSKDKQQLIDATITLGEKLVREKGFTVHVTTNLANPPTPQPPLTCKKNNSGYDILLTEKQLQDEARKIIENSVAMAMTAKAAKKWHAEYKNWHMDVDHGASYRKQLEVYLGIELKKQFPSAGKIMIAPREGDSKLLKIKILNTQGQTIYEGKQQHIEKLAFKTIKAQDPTGEFTGAKILAKVTALFKKIVPNNIQTELSRGFDIVTEAKKETNSSLKTKAIALAQQGIELPVQLTTKPFLPQQSTLASKTSKYTKTNPAPKSYKPPLPNKPLPPLPKKPKPNPTAGREY